MSPGEEICRGEIWWADLGDPRGSEPGFRRPVLIVQAESFNRSRLPTVLVAGITSNLKLASAPGNILISASASGLAKDSVINISQLLTLDRRFLLERIGFLPVRLQMSVDASLRRILSL